MKKNNLILSIVVLSTVFFSISVYGQTVTIGTQVWMTDNLNVDKFRNGEPIPQAKTDDEWIQAGESKQPAWCYYDNDSANGAKYGKLYNWYAISDLRGLAPEGWHVPSDGEWTILIDYLGKEEVGSKMKADTGWLEEGNGTNSSGFSGLPGGFRYYYGLSHLVGYNGYWWSSTEDDTGNAWYFYLQLYDVNAIRENLYYKTFGLSVRCIRD